MVVVDPLEVSNPTSLTWIHPTARKNDRIDARKQALLRSMNELPRCNMALGRAPLVAMRLADRAIQIQAQPMIMPEILCRSTKKHHRIPYLFGVRPHGPTASGCDPKRAYDTLERLLQTHRHRPLACGGKEVGIPFRSYRPTTRL